ncbi:arginine deiminase type-3 [Fusarium agapanthi]|uniref:Arginine deiminase type-3 n=1 Tax=Fusarium agapanthi TaxID=1803897 RepID=A0A9P5ECP6_9HYPO|nr:arginine deiminase type-3 [Fusarium agapanthi]
MMAKRYTVSIGLDAGVGGCARYSPCVPNGVCSAPSLHLLSGLILSLPTPAREAQPAARKLAELTYRALHRNNALPDMESHLVVRDEYLGWIHHKNEIDYYGVTFDSNVPSDEYFPEVLQINILEIEADEGEYANEYLPFTIDPADYIGKKILAVPRCCQKRKGSTDRQRVNGLVAERDVIRLGMDPDVIMKLLVGHGVSVYSTKIPEKRFDIVPRPPTGQAPKE